MVLLCCSYTYFCNDNNSNNNNNNCYRRKTRRDDLAKRRRCFTRYRVKYLNQLNRRPIICLYILYTPHDVVISMINDIIYNILLKYILYTRVTGIYRYTAAAVPCPCCMWVVGDTTAARCFSRVSRRRSVYF